MPAALAGVRAAAPDSGREGRRGRAAQRQRKAAGPVGAAIRDAMTPLVMRMLYRKGNPQAWILDHRIEQMG